MNSKKKNLQQSIDLVEPKTSLNIWNIACSFGVYTCIIRVYGICEIKRFGVETRLENWQLLLLHLEMICRGIHEETLRSSRRRWGWLNLGCHDQLSSYGSQLLMGIHSFSFLFFSFLSRYEYGEFFTAKGEGFI